MEEKKNASKEFVKNLHEDTSGQQFVIRIPKSARSNFKIARNQTHGQPFNFSVHDCPIKFMSVQFYLDCNTSVSDEEAKSPTSNSSEISFHSLSEESSSNSQDENTTGHELSNLKLSIIKRRKIELKNEALTRRAFNCQCLLNKKNRNKLEPTTCRDIAELRNRSYIKKVDFGTYDSTPSRLRRELKALAGKGSLQNCMGNPQDELKKEKHVAVPMRREMIGINRTILDEVKDAIETGTTHHCVQIILIKDPLHPLRKLLKNDIVASAIWTGPEIPVGHQVIFGVYVGQVRASRDMAPHKDAYALEIDWSDPHRRFIKDKSTRKKVSFHPLWKKQKSKKILTDDEWQKNLDDEIGWISRKLVLPHSNYFTIDSYDAFNEIAMLNDPRILSEDIRLESNAKFYQVYFEGWPYYLVANNMNRPVYHGEEILINCGAPYRFGHLMPLTETALLNQAFQNNNNFESTYCPDGWIKKQLFFESMDKMIDSVPDISWESDEELPDLTESDDSDELE